MWWPRYLDSRWPANDEPQMPPMPSKMKTEPMSVKEALSSLVSVGPAGPRILTDRPARKMLPQYTSVAAWR